ncbi:MAG: Asp-tRNA(Asn)/Glu-tRNA(Gln) amidotransferase subunit GatC [Patescibacteria group bacterium]
MVEIKDIEKLAALSRISLTEAEKAQMRTEIEAILGYVAQIQKVSGTPKTAEERSREKKDEVRNVLREDGVRMHTPGEYSEALLTNAPKRDGRFVKVKKILS